MVKTSSDLPVPLVVGAAFTLLAAFSGIRVVSERRESSAQESKYLHEIKLLAAEHVLSAIGEPPVATTTWFKGNHYEKIESLKARMKLLIEKNPWLSGRVVKRNRELFLVYNDYVEGKGNGLNLRHHHTESKISKDMPMLEMGRSLRSHTSLAENSLFKVTVLPCSESPTEFYAVIVSMSHIVADGHTYYSILNMLLDPSAPIVSLVVDRLYSTNSMQAEAMGGADKSQFVQTPMVIVPALLGLLLSKIPLFGPKRYQRFITVDNEKIEQLKKKYSSKEESFVSTNDILTSWFFRTASPPVGLMTINFRGRLEFHSDLLAGNYQNCIAYVKPDYTSPSLIRRSVQDTRRTGLESMPTMLQVMRNPLIPVIANWATFKKDYSDEYLHIPMVVDKPMPTTLPMAIVFRPTAGQTCLFITAFGGAGRRFMAKADFEVD